MAQLTKKQADELADRFLEISRAVDDYAWEHRSELTREQKDELDGLRRSLARQSEELTAFAISAALADVGLAVDRIASVTERAHDAVRHIKDVALVIKVASAAVGVGVALANHDLEGAGASIENLASQLQMKAGDAKKG
jgi:ribosome maturation protein Sdo1